MEKISLKLKLNGVEGRGHAISGTMQVDMRTSVAQRCVEASI